MKAAYICLTVLFTTGAAVLLFFAFRFSRSLRGSDGKAKKKILLSFLGAFILLVLDSMLYVIYRILNDIPALRRYF